MFGKRQPLSKKVLLWCAIPLEKHGSFEDFLFELELKLRSEQIEMHLVTIRGLGGKVAKVLENTTIQLQEVSHEEIESPFAFLEVAFRLRPQLIHFHFLQMTSPVIQASNACFFSEILFTEHSSIVEESVGLAKEYRKGKRTLNVSSIRKFFPVSHYIAEKMKERMWFPLDRIHTIHNGILVDRYVPLFSMVKKKKARLERLGIAEDRKVVFYVGRYAEEKGFHHILHVMRKWEQEKPEIFFVLIGFGPQENLLGTQQGKNFLNLGKRSDVSELLPMADVFIAPSIWGEAFGLTIAEASSCGVPVISTPMGGIPEIIEENETGFLIPPDNADALEDGLQHFFSMPEEKWIEMGKKGRQRIETNFSLEDKVNELFYFYSCFLGSTRTHLRESLKW